MRLRVPHLIEEAVIEGHKCRTHIAVSGRCDVSDEMEERYPNKVDENEVIRW